LEGRVRYRLNSGRVYGLGVMTLGMVCLAWGDFDLGQPVAKDFPDRTALAYAAAAFMLVAGAAVEWRRTAAWGANQKWKIRSAANINWPFLPPPGVAVGLS
jgi:hypothetical protein